MNFEEKIRRLQEELKNPLPGEHQQYLMAPEFRGKIEQVSSARKAAVLVCLIPQENDVNLIFIKRTTYDGPHSAQVSFPGGVFEESDTSLSETALRETREEIGLDLPKSAIIGELTPLIIPVSNMNVHPFVGYFNNIPIFHIDKREVDYIIMVSLEELMNPACIRREKWNLRGEPREVPFYKVKGETIWGATAMILSEFLEVLSRSALNQQSRY